MNKQPRFRDRIKQQLRPIAFALATFGVLLGCPPIRIVKEPLKTYPQDIRGKTVQETLRGKWKDGECWIEGNDTVAYSYRLGSEVEKKRYKTGGFLSRNEKVREIRCGVDKTHVLTDQNIFILEGASKAYFGKDGHNLDHGKVGLGKFAGRLIGWFPFEDDIFLISKDKIKFVSLDGGKSRESGGRFNENTKVIPYRDTFLIITPGERACLSIYVPEKGEVLDYEDNRIHDGKVSIKENEGALTIKIGEQKIKIKEGKVIFE